MTLVEVVLTLSISGLVLAPIMLLSLTATRQYGDTSERGDALARCQRTADRIADLLESATRASVVTVPAAPAWDDEISYDALTSVALTNGTVAVRGMRIRWRRDPADANDGADNDGDGLVDEGEVVVTHDVGLASQRETVLVRRVPELLDGEAANGSDDNGNGLADEAGFVVARVGNSVTLWLTAATAGRTGARELRLSTTQRTVRVRNWPCRDCAQQAVSERHAPAAPRSSRRSCSSSCSRSSPSRSRRARAPCTASGSPPSSGRS
jgi:hypothetical protein